MRQISQEKSESSGSAGGNKRTLESEARGGDKKAFEKLLVLYKQRLLNLAFRYTRNMVDAEDVVADSYEKAWQGFPTFRGESEVYTWLYRIVANMAKSRLAKERRVRTISLADMESIDEKANEGYSYMLSSHDELTSNLTPEHIIECDKTKEKIIECLSNMSDAHRDAFLMREVEGLTYEEMAAAEGIPVGTVKSRLFVAREHLAESLERKIRDK